MALKEEGRVLGVARSHAQECCAKRKRCAGWCRLHIASSSYLASRNWRDSLTGAASAGYAVSVTPANWLRSTFLSNLPTLVLGTASMNSTSSGSHHLATRELRYSRISSLVIWSLNSGLGTTHATGRSCQTG